MNENLFQSASIELVSTGRVSTTGTYNTKRSDFAGFNSAAYVVCFSSVTAGGANATLTFQMSTADSTAALTNAQGTIVSTKVTATPVNYRLMVMDIANLTERYGRVSISGCTAGTLNSVLCIKYNPRQPNSTGRMASTTIAGSTLLVCATSS